MKQRFFLSVSAIILGVLCSARPSLAGPSAAVVLQRNSLGAIPDGPAKDDGMAAGRAAAAAMIVNRTGDGSAPAQFYTPASDAPYQWQPDAQLRERTRQQPRPVLPLAVRQALRHRELGAVPRASGDRLQVIDPAHLARNGAVPPIHIEEIIADRKHYVPQDGLALPALTRDLEVDYTALSFRVPQRVQFRYRLDGRDPDWQDGGTRRQAIYTDLRSGEYRFHVIASNDDGVWNDSGAQLRFTIAAAWYQTSLVKIAAIAFALALGWILYQRRVKQVAAAITAAFDERLLERTRIPQDRHDTFVQTLQGSKLIADDALEPSTDQEHMRRALERLSMWIGQALLEARSALNSLRASIAQTTDLAEDLRRVADVGASPSAMSVSFSVSGEPREFHPIVRDEVCGIGSEAIRNALAHSMARQLLVTVDYERDMTLRVQDDGVGIERDMLATGKPGHFGLAGMRERAARIGAKLTIATDPGAGTDITLVVARNIAFKDGRRVRHRFFRRTIGPRG